MTKRIIRTDGAPLPVGPYSQATVLGDLVFTAGQIGLVPGAREFAGGDIQSQTRQALENLKAVLEAAGSGMEKALKITVFLKNMEDFPAMNEIFAEYFVADPPARSAVEAARLPLDALVEIECVAHK